LKQRATDESSEIALRLETRHDAKRTKIEHTKPDNKTHGLQVQDQPVGNFNRSLKRKSTKDNTPRAKVGHQTKRRKISVPQEHILRTAATAYSYSAFAQLATLTPLSCNIRVPPDALVGRKWRSLRLYCATALLLDMEKRRQRALILACDNDFCSRRWHES
jgi:hypothetical protein